jgi:hypothetical protein
VTCLRLCRAEQGGGLQPKSGDPPAGPQASRPLPRKRRTGCDSAASFLSASSCLATESVSSRNACSAGGSARPKRPADASSWMTPEPAS